MPRRLWMIAGSSIAGHRRVADDADIGLEQVQMRFEEGTQIGRGNLLFALEQELHIDRRAIAALQVRLQRLDVDEELPLVVGRAAGVDLAILHDRLERRRIPAIFDRRRHHVIVAIDEDGRLVCARAQPLAVDDRIPGGRHDRDVLGAEGNQVLREPLGQATDIVLRGPDRR